MENIKIVRLKSGEDVIGYVTEDENMVIIGYPMIVDLVKSQGVQSFVIQSWMPHQLFKHNEATLWLDDILFMSEVPDEFIIYYEDMVDKMTKYIAAEEILEHMKEEAVIADAMEERELSVLH